MQRVQPFLNLPHHLEGAAWKHWTRVAASCDSGAQVSPRGLEVVRLQDGEAVARGANGHVVDVRVREALLVDEAALQPGLPGRGQLVLQSLAEERNGGCFGFRSG